MKKLLVLNGSHSDVPLILAGKRLGFHVITAGTSPDLIGHRYSDEYHQIDFSDKEAILDLSKRLGIDAICSCANDFGALTASYVAEKMCLSGHDPHETASTLHLKHRFKAFASANNISTPYAKEFNSPEDACSDSDNLRFPLIVKPVDLTGGKGVCRVETKEEYIKAVSNATLNSRMDKVLVEEFIQGTYHSFTTFILNRKVIFWYSDNEFSYINPYLVTTSSAPASFIQLVEDQLKNELERIANLLSLCDGILHVQYIQSGSKAWIIEATRRCSGDFYPYPVNYATGLDWAEWIVRAESGFDCSSFPKAQQRGFFGRHCVMGKKNGIIKNIHISNEIEKNIIDRFMILRNGDLIDNYMINKLGVIFLRYDTVEEMDFKTLNINNLIYTEIE